MQSTTVLSCAVSAIALITTAHAQEAPLAASAGATVLDPIVVISDPLGRSQTDLTAGVVVLGGEELHKRRETTLARRSPASPASIPTRSAAAPAVPSSGARPRRASRC